jgi:hypothetical protein
MARRWTVLTKIRIDALQLDFQPEENLDPEIVAEYESRIAQGTAIPPVTVCWDGEAFWLKDGFHRVRAMRNLRLGEVEAEVISGTLAEMEAEFRKNLEEAKAELRTDTGRRQP